MAGMGPEARKEMGPRPPSLPPPPCPVRTSLSSRILGNCTAHKLRVDTDTAVCATLRTNTIWVMGRKAQIPDRWKESDVICVLCYISSLCLPAFLCSPSCSRTLKRKGLICLKYSGNRFLWQTTNTFTIALVISPKKKMFKSLNIGQCWSITHWSVVFFTVNKWQKSPNEKGKN